MLEAHGWGDLHVELNSVSKQGRWREVIALIDDDILTTIAGCGSPTDVAPQLANRFGGVADRVAFYLPYAVADGQLVSELLDAVRSPATFI